MEPSSPETPVIEMSGVTVASAPDLDGAVLEGVNWTVRAGEYWVVAGLHASGKGALLSMIAGLAPPLDGEYRMFGRRMPMEGDELAAGRLRLGMVFEQGQLLHQLTVKENIALPLRYHRDLSWQEIEERVRMMLEATELTPHAEAMPGKLALHWRKRVGLARALMLEPEVLLVDNPLAGLDPRETAWWLNFLGALSAGRGVLPDRRVTLVVTTEDLRPWRALPCHFALLRERQFRVLGRGAKLAGHEDPLVKELLALETQATVE